MTAASPQRVLDRLAEIEAAIEDLKPTAFGTVAVGALGIGGLIERRYRNRLHGAFLLLYHLQDDVRKLAKRSGIASAVVNNFVGQSRWVQLCIRAGNTHKHGLGGRSRNATIPNGLICVVKTALNHEPSPQSEALVVGMTVADAEMGAFPSQGILEGALRDWGAFLKATFGLETDSLLNSCFPPPQGPVLKIATGHNLSVPPGATLKVKMPPELQEMAKLTAAKLRDQS